MSFDAAEFLKMPSLINLNLKFFSAEQQIRKFRRHQRVTVGTILPIGAELVFATGAYPIFPLRIGKFNAEKLMRGIRLTTNILGSELVGAGARIMQPQANDIIDQLLGEYTQNLSAYETRADTEFNFLPEACFATRIAFGSSLPYKQFVKLFHAWGTRCSWFSQFYQLVNDTIPIVFTDIPSSNAPYAKQYMYDELEKLIHKLETLTGIKLTDDALREKIEVTNEIRASYREIFTYLKTPEKMPASPYLFMQALSVLNIALIDFLSAPKYFNKNFTKFMKDLRARDPIDCSDVPKLLIVPVFSGNEPDLPGIVHRHGGMLIIADWYGYGLLDPIKTQGNMLQNYGDYLIRTHIGWKDNKTICESWLRMAKDFKVDGILFNKLIGCTSITPAYRLFKERVRDEGIPMIDIDFNRIGENLAQIENKIASFIEMLKKK